VGEHRDLEFSVRLIIASVVHIAVLNSTVVNSLQLWRCADLVQSWWCERAFKAGTSFIFQHGQNVWIMFGYICLTLFMAAKQDLLHTYSHMKSESLAQIHTAVAERKFLGIVFYWHTLNVHVSDW